MEYKDDKGNVIPQSTMIKNIDLQENNRLMRRAIIIFGIFGLWALVLATWVLYKLERWDIITKAIRACL